MFDPKLSEYLPRGYETIVTIVALMIFIFVFIVTMTKMRHAWQGVCEDACYHKIILLPLWTIAFGTICVTLLIWGSPFGKNDINHVVVFALILLFAITQLATLATYYFKHK